MPKTLSVIVPAYNEEAYLGECLTSILKHRKPNVVEVIVVDNASTDGTAALARSFPGITVIREEKKGLTVARQCGFQHSKGELLAYIDADCRLPPEWYDIVNREFDADPRLVCLSGMYKYYDLPLLQSAVIRLVWLLAGSCVYLFTSNIVVGGNFIARRTAIERIGGFDTSIEFYGEDTDLGKRISKVGRVKFVSRLYAITSGRRWTAEGFWRIGARYVLNFAWETLFSRPFSKTYRDIR